MEPISIVHSTFVPLPADNIDTDQIIPARFLKATSREGFGDHLFRDWRYLGGDKPNPGFVLNQSQYSGEILVAGTNFGCGSSREHAAWALSGYGFRVVISSFFADIFYSNALNNGLLPLQVPSSFVRKILAEEPDSTLTVNLFDCWLQIDRTGDRIIFPISEYKRECLLNGYEDIDYLLSLRDEISKYERNRDSNPLVN